ncbi:amidohydrolase family protein [Nocardiopsis sp. LSu2-4]|uniref:Amidohydrolase family protein n=1 Tax=Nocardiopsis suaedae TaxID=3018444 RepID=A0ABT4TN36_9ACTN|nr:amidohydrolase family protein [Nocardiopsis suaedae]MDA2806107.1 amidohydrolase family protein [Nocardiopsis suaedae]
MRLRRGCDPVRAGPGRIRGRARPRSRGSAGAAEVQAARAEEFVAAYHGSAGGQPDSDRLVRMLTIAGARALALSDGAGGLEPGRRADVAPADTDHPRFEPYTDLPALAVTALTADRVESALVEGRVLVSGGRVQPLDEGAARDDLPRPLPGHRRPSSHPDSTSNHRTIRVPDRRPTSATTGPPDRADRSALEPARIGAAVQDGANPAAVVAANVTDGRIDAVRTITGEAGLNYAAARRRSR